MDWAIYILSCADDTLYTGIARDLERRLAQHAAGQGARYMKGRSPFKLVYREVAPTRGEALRRELAIKRLDRAAKLALIAQGSISL